MDWLLVRQDRIEKKLAARHLSEGCFVFYDVTSSYYEGRCCPLARYGHDRDGKKGRPIIVYGLMTDGEGRPVAVEAYPGDTGDPSTVPEQAEKKHPSSHQTSSGCIHGMQRERVGRLRS
jgi:transposase